MAKRNQHPLRRFGYIPDLPDFRDYAYKLKAPAAPLQSVDLRKTCTMPPIFDQLSLGACTANSISFLLGFNILNKHEAHAAKASLPFSRLFIYYNERDIEGTISQDSGAEIRDGIKSVAAQGSCSEKVCKYDITRFARKPTKTAFSSAIKHKALTYERLDSTNKAALVDCLAHGFPFTFGFTVYDSFMSDAVAKTGVVPMPGPKEQVQGGHAVTCVGYDLPTDRFIVANSWGEGWGDKGYFTIPAAYLTNTNLADDFWMITMEM